MFVTIHDPVLQSIKDGEKYDVEVIFRKGKAVDDGWGKRTAIGNRDAEGKAGFFLQLNGPEGLTDFDESNNVSFWYKDKIVESLTLKGSSLMVAAMKRCASEIIKNHPIDPFEE